MWCSGLQCYAFSALTLLVWQQEGAACKKWVVGCWRGMYLGQGADLHMAQLMPLPLTISCSSKSRLVYLPWFIFLVLPFWCRLTRVVPERIQEGSKTVVCMCMCMCVCLLCGILMIFSAVCYVALLFNHTLKIDGQCSMVKLIIILSER